MGHIVNSDREYRLLQQRYDRMVTGAPDSPVLMQILTMLFSPEDAHFARRMPVKPTSLEKLSKTLEMPLDELSDRIADMAARGLVLDFEIKGTRYAMLPPVVIGFFEFTFMRARDTLDMKKLSELFQQYMYEDDRFAHSVFGHETQIGRSLVHEQHLPEEDHVEILDYERASKVVDSAWKAAVSMCACRHKAQHLGHACSAPMDVCLTLNGGAATLIRHGIAREISIPEARAVLDRAKAANLAQTADNVKKDVSYICNCCGCCCGMMNAVRHFDIRSAIVSSNWIMEVDQSRCKGCGKCATACPVSAIAMETVEENGKKRMRAVRDESLCLGCGVCPGVCKFNALSMTSREKRVFTPENTFDRMVHMALERGKLMDLIFDSPENLGYRALGRILSIIEKTPPGQALLGLESVRSVFLNAAAKAGKRA